MNSVSHDSLALFLDAARSIVGDGAVDHDAPSLSAYLVSTIQFERQIGAAIRVTSREQVVQIVRAANEHHVPLYPISTGNNWGYGSALPATDGCVVLDLSAMNRIISIDARSGVAILEPGVTQQMLRDYLDTNGLNFLCPVTGAGPNCSLVGNAIERGYGITPIADHFLSVMSLEAVLPDGRIYTPPLAAAGCERVEQIFKWGIGPYLDGLFTQSSMGIVTQMSIKLAPRPDVVNGFFFGVRRDDDLEEVVDLISGTLADVGGVLGSINLMNARRVVSMMEPYPANALNAQGIVDADHIASVAAQHQVTPWMGAGALYGNRLIAAAARKAVKQRLKGKVKRLMFFSPESVQRFHRLSQMLPFATGRAIENLFATLTKTLAILAGTPSTVALPLAYWRGGTMPGDQTALNPARDGCGLIWYSPLVPMDPGTVRDYSNMVERVCADHGIEPLITLTSLSEACFDSTVPVLFDPAEPGAKERAHACYRALLEEGRAIGCTPYRAPVSEMPRFMDTDAPYWQLVAMVKAGLDPHNIIAPGRYAPSP